MTNPLVALRIPPLNSPPGNAMTRPREVEAWLQQLPMASVGGSAPSFLQALHDSNRTPIPPAARLQMAALLAPPIGTVLEILERSLLDAALPLSTKLAASAALGARLYEELAISYKLALHDLARNTSATQEREALAKSLFEAIGYLAGQIQMTVLVYQPYPAHVWRELHNLYQFAERAGLTKYHVKIRIKDEEIPLTVQDRYAQALLFAAAAPYRLRQRDIHHLWRNLPKWVRLAQLAPAGELSRKASQFLVRLDQDHPPVHISLVDGSLANQPALILDTEPLLQHLEEASEQISLEMEGIRTTQMALSKSSVQRLLEAWGTVPQRRFWRTHLNFDLDLTVGLPSIHRLLSETGASATYGSSVVDAEPTRQETPSIAGGARIGAATHQDWENDLSLVPLTRGGHGGREDDKFLSQGDWWQRPAPPAAPAVWNRASGATTPVLTGGSLSTLNESVGGYCVEWRDPKLPGIRIGELVGVRLPGAAPRYLLCVARWMRNVSQTGLQVGLQVIASNALAITATSEQSPPLEFAALLVTPMKATRQTASLVTPILPLTAGQTLGIRQNTTKQQILLLKLVESTGAFAQFEFEYA